MNKKIIIILAILLIMLAISITLPVRADNATTASNTSPLIASNYNVACLQTAIEKRDNAMIATLTIYNGAIIPAISARADALKSAWGLANQNSRSAAIKKAWSDFLALEKASLKALKADKRVAWSQFRKDKAVCKVKKGFSLEGLLDGDYTHAANDLQL